MFLIEMTLRGPTLMDGRLFKWTPLLFRESVRTATLDRVATRLREKRIPHRYTDEGIDVPFRFYSEARNCYPPAEWECGRGI